ncbi:conserved hypothetical protein [Culex quinquefasciatus]|uniref:Uncharacterized protein n=1 Tax=Culex quinquefasciatus TaxID=7176 RepID=B0WTR6_CULQU|nr:conserved hypothetical protein [Culex quinquefasciatus]|eukprot:XP_001855513.1 conserved hypothetical protein [Culex quinquefasciatus]
MATIMSHNLPLIPLPLKASLAKTGLMMSGLLGKEVLYGSGPTERSSPVSEARSSPESVMMMAGGQPKEDDRMSCCSEDSELSVGQEVDLDGSDKTMNGDENRSVASSRIGGLDVEKLIDRHSVEVGEEEPSEEYMKIPVMRPSPTRLHEEFLRNSQLYAEELMRQQMQIVAAARGLNLSPKPLDPTLGLVTRLQDNRSPGKPMFTEEQKLGFRPHIRGVGDLYPDPNRCAAGCSGTNSSGPSRSFNSSSSSASGSEVDVPASPQSSTGSSKTGEGTSGSTTTTSGSGGPMVWPAWVYCTRYSDRPSSVRKVMEEEETGTLIFM